MTIKDLQNELEYTGVPEELYSIMSGGLPNERLCIVKENSWQVYYSERGQKTGLRTFPTETEACEYFLKKMRRYAKA